MQLAGSSSVGRTVGGLRRAALLTCVLALAATACGDGGGGTTPTTPPPTGAPTSGPTTPDAPTSDPGSEPFYAAGDLIEIINPFAPGGGNDVSARFLAEYFTDRLPGNPTFNVVSMPGAAGIIGGNHFVQSMDADGYSILYTSGSNNFVLLFGNDAVEYDYAEMIPLVGLPTGRPLYVLSDFPSPAELVESEQTVVFAMEDPLGAYAVDLIGFDILGLNIQAVAAYDGAGPMTIALEQGEIDLFGGSTGHYFTTMVDLIEAGTVRGFMSHGQLDGDEIVRDPAFPDMPTLVEVYEEIYGEPPSGLEFDTYKALLPALTTSQKVMWAHGDAPEAAVREWEALCLELLGDDDFFEDGTDLLGPYRLVCGDDLRNVVNTMISLPEANLNWALDFLVEEYDAIDPR